MSKRQKKVEAMIAQKRDRHEKWMSAMDVLDWFRLELAQAEAEAKDPRNIAENCDSFRQKVAARSVMMTNWAWDFCRYTKEESETVKS